VTELSVVLRTPWGGPWRAFRDPLAVLTAHAADDVGGVLAEVDRAVRGERCYAAGFVTYEAAGAFGLPVKAPAPGGLPVACFGLFNPGDVTFQGRPRSDAVFTHSPWTPSIDRYAYLDAVRNIKERIEAGDTYQINFTFRLRAAWSGDPIALLGELDAAQGGAWGGYVDLGSHVVCSASPELFFSLVDGRLECRPMKGTAARGLWSADDIGRGEALRASPKNRAENVMIVDMVRNDLGRLARVGSVEVSSMFDLERYPRQWQMVSTVAAEARGATLPVLFETLFPSGSVTGAPKHSSMGIIRDLEDSPRGIYTGAIGYVSPNRRAHFNVAIRTITLDRARGEAEFGVGSGIVWDSDDRDEYDECVLKASILTAAAPPFRLLETIGFAPGAGFTLLDRHLERLRASAEYFGYEFDEAATRDMLARAVDDLKGASKVRLLLSRDGSLVCEAVDLGPGPGRPLRAALAAAAVNRGDVFLYHKTTHRAVYEEARASRPDADAVILWNEAGEITEATEANIVAELDGRRVTPPVECGLLAGTLRGALIEERQIVERRMSIDELRLASRLWLINSVRGWMDAELID
jgi:para-aminobenzoate synthetase/4-amino-4-deoxychorismate lyase